MINEKIKTFAVLPNDSLSKLSEEQETENTMHNLRSIEKEFEQTNLHTKQTQENANNTDNTDNTYKIDTDATIQDSQPKKKNNLGSVVNAGFAIYLMDLLIPTVLILIINYVGYSLDKKEIQLTKAEKEALEPAVSDVLAQIELDFSNPYINLGVMLAIVYGTKLIDKRELMKKKTPVIPKEKKDITESIAEIVNATGEAGEENTALGKFEIDYGKLVDEIRLTRKRGVGDAKEYLAKNYNEKIRSIARKHGVPLNQIREQLEFTWTPKKREPKIKAGDEFELE